MKNLIQDGTTIQYTVADKPVKSGEMVVIEDMVAIAITDGAVGETISLAVEGVYRLPKGTGAIKQGEKVYANVAADGTKTVVTAATGNTFIGYAWNSAGAADTTIDVNLPF